MVQSLRAAQLLLHRTRSRDLAPSAGRHEHYTDVMHVPEGGQTDKRSIVLKVKRR